MAYSVTEGNPRESGRHRVVRDRDDLAAYFGQRVLANEHLELVSLRIKFDPDRNLGHMSLVVRRTADDLAGLGIGNADIATGKGAIDCGDGKIVVWSIAMRKSPTKGGTFLCTNPPPKNPDRLPLACAGKNG